MPQPAPRLTAASSRSVWKPVLGLALLALALPSAEAQSTTPPADSIAAADGAGFTQRGAHVHGRVTVNLALEGRTLIAELDAPAINVVGFERAPRDAAETSRVQRIDRWLSSGVGVLGVPRTAGCTRTKVEYNPPKPDGSHDADHDSEGHADYEARFTYTCSNPGDLAWADLWLLHRLENVAEVEVNLLTPTTQTRLTVAADSPRIALQ